MNLYDKWIDARARLIALAVAGSASERHPYSPERLRLSKEIADLARQIEKERGK